MRKFDTFCDSPLKYEYNLDQEEIVQEFVETVYIGIKDIIGVGSFIIEYTGNIPSSFIEKRKASIKKNMNDCILYGTGFLVVEIYTIEPCKSEAVFPIYDFHIMREYPACFTQQISFKEQQMYLKAQQTNFHQTFVTL